jgi:type IV secretory pathway VirJ component
MADIIKMLEEQGELVTGDDGFVYYWPSKNGALSAHDLRIIADELDRRNARWEAEITAYFAKTKRA